MEKSKIVSGDIDWRPPLRRLNDFILEPARFDIPNIKNLEKWNNRVVNNLLYYQSNYFLTAIAIFILVGLIHPKKMLLGMIAISIIVLISAYLSMEGRAVHNLKKQYPGAGIVIILIASSFMTYTLDSLLVFLLGILLPIAVIFVHASLRMRNTQNKIMNKIEKLGLVRTPMGVLLEELGDITSMVLSEQTCLMQKKQ